MSLTTTVDRAGKTLQVVELNGKLYPRFDLESLKGVATFKARPDDVCVCAYPKSGTHWVWEITRVLLANSTDIPNLEKDVAMIEDVPPADLENLPSPRVVNTHYQFDDLYPIKGKIIYVTRDPRDVAVSFYNHHKKLVQYYDYHGEWKDYVHMYIAGKVDYNSWFDYTKSWEKGIRENPEIPIFVTSYESLQSDTMAEIKKLAQFLGTPLDDEEFFKKVIQKCSFSNMKVTKGDATPAAAGSPVMYRKGKVGDWKNWFTVAQSEVFDFEFERQMKETNAYDLYSRTVLNTSDPNMND